MEENKNPQVEENNIDYMAYVRKLLKSWKKLLVAAGIGAVVGLVIAFTTPRTYTASATLAPELSSKSGGSSLSSLASLAGLNISQGANSSALTPELFPQIIASNPLVAELFSMPVQFEKGEETITTDYYTYLKKYQKSSLIGAVVSAPGKVLGWFLGLFKKKEPKVEGYANIDPLAMTKEQEKIAKAIRKDVTVEVDKKTYVTSLSATAQDPKIAKQLADSVIAKLTHYVSNYTTEKSRKDLEYYQKLCSEAKTDYYRAQQSYARYTDTNQDIVLHSRRTEAERLQNEMQLKFNLYNACAQQVQQAQAAVQRDKPMFSVVDPASVPIKPSSTSKSKTLLIWIFIGILIEGAWICFDDTIKDFFRKLKSDDSSEQA